MKLLAFAGVILAGLAAVVNGVSADIKDRGASIARSTVNDAETVKIRDNATAIVSPLMTTRKCSPGGDDILSCQSGSCTKMASCEWPTLCCVTDLANVDPVGCHCKIDTRTSPSQDLDQAGKPAISDEKNTLNWSAKPWTTGAGTSTRPSVSPSSPKNRPWPLVVDLVVDATVSRKVARPFVLVWNRSTATNATQPRRPPTYMAESARHLSISTPALGPDDDE
ncbi:hypothetical protein K504DRAFT_534946 [Pleomassaria siparia CBS 279.74]|uniref:Extracellular membrane protein CFEM domain-containing protein n=1 Tax=Pleomassaria siparia CBS 279.74 TaxID=1314801 RepID=A0A6G1K7H8_9PLEO|nr:hypothetical protein K504DRAFT_534946 [Pleomassaria siparia CBS 279.74]